MSENTCDSNMYLSVVSPAYNESENLPQLVKEVSSSLTALGKNWEFIVVNDASQDNSLNILRQMRQEYPQLRILSLCRRSGQTAALDAGLRRARGDIIAMLDADLQNDPQDIIQMLRQIEAGRCDMVSGWRRDRNDPWLRLVSTRIANGVRNWLTHEQVHDSASGLKVFRRDCIADIKLFNGMHRFLPTLVRLEGYQVTEVPVRHRPRNAGKAKYGVWNRVFKALRDTFAVRWMQNRQLRYEIKEDSISKTNCVNK
jgi:glycosyltransferase involved in cell wall biosynthesis